MPSSQISLKTQIAARDRLLAEKDAELVAQAAEILTLKMQIGAQDNVIGYQNGGFDEIKQLIEEYPGGMVAKIVAVLERHGVKVQTQRRALQ